MAELSVAEHSGKGRPAEILLVEDNPGDAVLTKKAFSTLKFTNTITHAEDANKAMALLKNSKKPDLILLDINLPGKGGIFLLEEIRKDAALRNIPVLMLTSSKAMTDISSSYDLDATSYLMKPLSLERLAPALAKLPNFWCALMVADEA